MSNKEKMMELLDLAFDIQAGGHADDHPYVNVTTSNYGKNIEIIVNDNGFSVDNKGNCIYQFTFNDVVERTYQNCKQHFEDLKVVVQARGEVSG